MENQDDNAELNKYTQDRIDKSIEKLNTEKELKIKWRNEFMNNKPFMKYLEEFRVGSSKSPIDDYITIRYRWFEHGNLFKDILEKERTKWIDFAFIGLGAILQKKLFDLQCLWRAKQITIPSINISKSFDKLERDIFNCDFLDPITEVEIAMYQDFLTQGDFIFNDYEDFCDWQNYEVIKYDFECECFESMASAWYSFQNKITGNSKLFLLPDSKGIREQFYLDLVKSHRYKMNPQEALKENQITDSRPFFNIYEDKILLHILKSFDTKEAQNLFEYYYEGFERRQDENEVYKSIFNELIKVNEVVPIESHINFKEAIKKAYHRYKCKKIADHMPIAYEQYLLNRQFGFSIPSNSDSILWTMLILSVENTILDGRELSGESRDFNF